MALFSVSSSLCISSSSLDLFSLGESISKIDLNNENFSLSEKSSLCCHTTYIISENSRLLLHATEVYQKIKFETTWKMVGNGVYYNRWALCSLRMVKFGYSVCVCVERRFSRTDSKWNLCELWGIELGSFLSSTCLLNMNAANGIWLSSLERFFKVFEITVWERGAQVDCK